MEQLPGTEPKSFEAALARLEEIAASLDRNDIPLRDALALCQEAAEVSRYCRATLTEAEGTLERVIETSNGELRLVEVDEP